MSTSLVAFGSKRNSSNFFDIKFIALSRDNCMSATVLSTILFAALVVSFVSFGSKIFSCFSLCLAFVRFACNGDE